MSDAPRPVSAPPRNPGTLEGQMHRVQVTIKLQRAPCHASLKAGHHSRCFRPASHRAFHIEAISLQQFLQPVRHGCRLTGWAGHIDECHRCVQQPLLVDGMDESFSQFLIQHPSDPSGAAKTRAIDCQL